VECGGSCWAADRREKEMEGGGVGAQKSETGKASTSIYCPVCPSRHRQQLARSRQAGGADIL